MAWKPNIVTMENVSHSTNNYVSSELLNVTILNWGVAYSFRLKILRGEVIRYKILQLRFWPYIEEDPSAILDTMNLNGGGCIFLQCYAMLQTQN